MTFFEKTKWVWINGEIVPWDNATAHVSTHALHYGTGVFEGIRSYPTDGGPAVFRLTAHLDRLFASAEVYDIDIPYSRVELAGAICEVIGRNEFTNCYIRPICYFGSDSLGIRARCPVETVILTWPDMGHIQPESRDKGLRVTISPWVKFHSKMMPTTAKACGQYLNSRLAVTDALRRGYDEALLLNADGNLAEAAVENIFLVKDGVVITNDESSSVLLGITRDSVITIARDLGYPVEIRIVSVEDLLSADEAFLTGTASEVVSIREVDETPIGRFGRGPITKHIQHVFSSVTCGKDQHYASWIYPITR